MVRIQPVFFDNNTILEQRMQRDLHVFVSQAKQIAMIPLKQARRMKTLVVSNVSSATDWLSRDKNQKERHRGQKVLHHQLLVEKILNKIENYALERIQLTR